jgi:glycosyltransferase involved in cell wall biosynthesis
MIVAFFTPELSHPSGKRIGGLGNVALEMLNYLTSKQEDLTVYVFSPSSIRSSSIQTEIEGNIHYHWFPDSMISVEPETNFNLYILAMNSMMIEYVETTYLSMDSEFFQIIHCHDWMTAPVLLKFHTMKYPKTRRIFHLHSSEIGRNGNKILYNDADSMKRHMLEVEGSHSADLVVAVSEKFRDEIATNFNVDIDKIQAVNNGMDFTSWLGYADEDHDDVRKSIAGIGKNDPVFLFCGRLVWQKNPKLLFDAFMFLADKFPNAHLVFMGNGHMMNQLETMASRKGVLNKQVHFLGSVYGCEKKKWYRSADCLVVSSFNEPFGLIFLEALVCRTTVLYPVNVAANKFLEHRKHGLRFIPKVIDLAKTMVSIIKEKELVEEMGRNGYDYVLESFNDKVMGENLYKEYLKINKLETKNENDIYFT